MSPQPKSDIVEALEQSAKEFLDAANVSASIAGRKPADGRWSVLDCIEHVTTVEERFRSRLVPADGVEAPPADGQKEAALQARVVDRSNRVQAPDVVHPQGRFGTLAEAVEEFKAVRARTMRFAEEHASGLYSLTVTHPMLGLLNGMEALTIIAAHSRRHAEQMREAA